MKKHKPIFEAIGWIGKNVTENDLLIACSSKSWGLADFNSNRGFKRDWKPDEWPPRRVKVVVQAE